MGNEWHQFSFEDAPLQILDGDRGKNYPNRKEFCSSGHCIFLNTGNVTRDGFDFSDLDFISQKRDELLRKGKLQRQDVVLTTRGTVGNVGYFDNYIPHEHIRINSGMVILRPDQSRLDSRFLYLFLRSRLFSAQVEALRTGSAQPQLPIRDIKKVEISFPELKEQKSIAHILGTLDDKIELNRQMNATLEAMAQALFKSWFIDFDPVLDNAIMAGNPIPDELQERAELRRAILAQNQPSPPAPLPLGEGGRRSGEGAKHDQPSPPAPLPLGEGGRRPGEGAKLDALAAGNPIPEPLHNRARQRGWTPDEGARRASATDGASQARAAARAALGDQRAGQHVWTSDEDARRASATDGASHKRKPLPEAIQQQFPSSFVFSEEMGWVPEGWGVDELPTVIDFLEGPGIRNWQYTEEDDGIKFINIRCIQNGDLSLDTASRISRKEAFGKYAHFQLQVNDIVISTSGTLGRYAFVREEHLPLSLNTSVIRFRQIDGVSTLHYIAGYVETRLQWELETRASGSVQLNFGPMHLNKIKMLLPRFQVLQAHDAIITPLFKKRQENFKSTDNLSRLRDTLLPKLLSGQLRIPDAEKLMEGLK